MTAPKGCGKTEVWWQSAQIRIEPNQLRISEGGMHHASGN